MEVIQNNAAEEQNFGAKYYTENSDSVYTDKPVYDFFKRLFDIVFSFIALVVLSPILVIISIIICTKDFGNPFYVQNRIKKDEKVFKMYKFRSMYTHSEELQEKLKNENDVTDISLKLENDPRIIKGLNFIRDYSLDELLQLINVLKGDMTIVGPRPLPIYEYEQIKSINQYKPRFKVKQGLSCYWQVYRTKDTTFDDRMKMDLIYIKERSFITDLKIIIKTFGVVFEHKNY